MSLLTLAEALRPLLASQGRLVRLPANRPVVFVGDTHGDIDATQRVLERFAGTNRVLLFLGDAVDRGPDSAGNLRLILQAKGEHPEDVYLLMGNHEAWSASPFTPADFWQSLPPKDRTRLAEVLGQLPFVATHPSGVLGVHGALPDLPTLESVEHVTLDSEAWRAMIWGDWHEASSSLDGGGRPSFGRSDFERRADRLGIRVLVRSHQPNAPERMYDNRCLTLFTSNEYGSGPRRVALLDPSRRIESALDLRVESIDDPAR